MPLLNDGPWLIAASAICLPALVRGFERLFSIQPPLAFLAISAAPRAALP